MHKLRNGRRNEHIEQKEEKKKKESRKGRGKSNMGELKKLSQVKCNVKMQKNVSVYFHCCYRYTHVHAHAHSQSVAFIMRNGNEETIKAQNYYVWQGFCVVAFTFLWPQSSLPPHLSFSLAYFTAYLTYIIIAPKTISQPSAPPPTLYTRINSKWHSVYSIAMVCSNQIIN